MWSETRIVCAGRMLRRKEEEGRVSGSIGERVLLLKAREGVLVLGGAEDWRHDGSLIGYCLNSGKCDCIE